MESIAHWQLPLHPDGQLHQGYSAKGRKRGQHDHGSQGAPVSGGIRHVWTGIRELNPKTLNPMVILTPLSHKLGDPSRPVDTSSNVSALDDAEASLEEIPTTPSPTAETSGPNSGAPPADAGHLKEEANKALGGLLTMKSSIDAHQQKLVWELGMDLCWNNSETTESIKEVKAICAHSTQEAKTLCSPTIKEAKATSACSIQEAKTLCSLAIRDAEAQGASQADSLHQSHDKSIRHLEEQAIKEESKSQLNFLSVCQAALWNSTACW